ncbi:hypothetical protein ACF0H5_001570 [Mactra antiquata]
MLFRRINSSHSLHSMMPPKRQALPLTFPHRTVFVISFVLCLCACASIVNAVLAWNNLLWGFYFGTGFWCGAIILLAGMFGIVASFVRNICSVKTYMIISIFGCMASLGMIALAAGGLDSDSGFYDGNNRGVLMTHVVHAVYLGLGLLQLTMCVLSDGVCVYYLFIEKNAEIYHMSNSKTRNSDTNLARESKSRSSTGSEIPLVGRNSSKRKQSENGDNDLNNKKSGSNNNIENDAEEEPIRFNTVKPLNRAALQRQENVTSPIRNMRSASFSTFGRYGSPERAALIVHPTDDDASFTDTIGSYSGSYQLDENAYAQIPLFGPPIPIEDDDELPPYQAFDAKRLKRKRGMKRPKSEEIHLQGHPARRAHTTPVRGKRKLEKRAKTSQNQPQIPPERVNNSCEDILNKQQRLSNMDDKANGRRSMKRLSRSADLLSVEDGASQQHFHDGHHNINDQGVNHNDFAHSSDMILVMDDQVPLRHRRSNQTQSLRTNRDKRLDRRRKALSAEVRLNKDQFLGHERFMNDEVDFQYNTLDGSNPSLYAGNRIMTTKFSLRRPMRKSGHYVSAPVPVKPIVSIPSVKSKPPPKPPRTHSVSVEDFTKEEKEINYDVEVENLFSGIKELNDVDDVFSNEPFRVSTSVESTIKPSNIQTNKKKPPSTTYNNKETSYAPNSTINYNTYTKSKSSVPKSTTNSSVPFDESPKTIESKPIAYVSSTQSVPLSPEAKLDSGPVVTLQPKSPEVKLDSGPMLKFVPLKQLPGRSQTFDGQTPQQPSNKENKNESSRRNNSMVLPTSPILKPPPVEQKNITSWKNNQSVENVQHNRSMGSLGDTKMIKLPETPKTINNTRPMSGGDNIVYAHVRKTKVSPVSPVESESSLSSTSPTSPTARMMKARRLLYSFTDKDINVFDPVSTGTESEEVFEVTDTQKVNFPVQTSSYDITRKERPSVSVSSSNTSAISNIVVRSPPTSPLEKNQGDRKRENPYNFVTSDRDLDKKRDKPGVPETTSNVSAISNITVRSSPLSASERILQRRAVKSDNITSVSDSKDRPVILQPVMSSPSRHSYGARPKTKYQGLFAPLPPPKPKPLNKPVAVQPYENTKRVSNENKPTKVTASTNSTRSTNSFPLQATSQTRNYVQPQSTTSPTSKTQTPLPSPLTSSNLPSSSTPVTSLSSTLVSSPTMTLGKVNPDPIVVNNVHIPIPSVSFSASREIPVNRVQATPTVSVRSSNNSQGVQHLPQSQYSRQVSDESPQPVFANQPQPVARAQNANVEHDNNENSANTPFFSVVL